MSRMFSFTLDICGARMNVAGTLSFPISHKPHTAVSVTLPLNLPSTG